MDEATAKFRLEFKKNLIEWLQLEDKAPEEIKDDEPLFGLRPRPRFAGCGRDRDHASAQI